jgi:4-hydroxy-tetrahydrodipicolinate synthase
MAALTKWLCGQKVSALFPMGGTGEYTKLNHEERKKIIDLVVANAPDGCAVVPGVGSTSLELTLDLARYAQEKGADGVAVVVPDFIDESENAIFDYYRAIDDAVNIPIMVYDPRGSGPRSITPALMTRFVNELKHISAIKYRTDEAMPFTRMVRAARGKVAVLSGIEMNYLQMLAGGGVGVVGGGANIFPNLIACIHENYYAGKVKEALRCQFLVNDANEALERGTWPLGGKIALKAMGLPITTFTRNEHRPVTPEDEMYVAEFFRNLKY